MVPGQQRPVLTTVDEREHDGGTRRCAVLGSPIAHSLSPALHRAAYAELGLDWSYDAHEVDEGGLAGFLAGLGPAWRGLSLTMPLKRVAIALCDEVSDLALTVDAVNTVLLDDDGRRRGTNTDVAGMVAAFRERGVTELRDALLVGVGATACSALAALAELKVGSVRALARDPSRAVTLRRVGERLGVPVQVDRWAGPTEPDAQPPVHAVVSTVPAEAVRAVGGAVADRAEVVFDVLYHPWPTPLAEAALAAGRVVLGGLDLLVHQAARQVELMTGVPVAPVPAMRAAGERALADRH